MTILAYSRDYRLRMRCTVSAQGPYLIERHRTDYPPTEISPWTAVETHLANEIEAMAELCALEVLS